MAFQKLMRAEAVKPIEDEEEKKVAVKTAARNRRSGSVPAKKKL